jgi:hypothetical protein
LLDQKKKPNFPLPFKRKVHKPRATRMLTYDLETTRIEKGTPTPLYVTMFGILDMDYQNEFITVKGETEYRCAEPLDGLSNLLEVLATRFLIPELDGVKFVAWNGNNFDIYLIAKALLLDDRYVMRPYMTRSKSLRGMRVIDQVSLCEFEFLDGIAMTGCVMTLEKFLKVFAPDYQKLTGVIDFEKETFDSRNQKHCEYAMRDSVGLWYALIEAQRIIREAFGHVLTPTIGNLGIKIFQQYLPPAVAVQPLTDEVDKIMRDYVMRGGYCYCARRFTGRVWKYDINQAYAAAMREAWLPDGYADRVSKYWSRYPGIYRITAKNRDNKIPFYYRDSAGDAIFGMQEITDTWITSSEYDQLLSEGWKIKIVDGYLFGGRFKMQEYVDTLEHLRMTAIGGTNGAKGLMMKAIGNNSYGKTVEQLDGVEYVMCNECPEGYLAVISNDPEADDLPIWTKQGEPVCKDYHKPQIGAFITAHVRMVVRRAALTNPGAWLYADTDCVIFTEAAQLDIDPGRYGAWKVECEGDEYRIIAKKVYAKTDNSEKHAKGLNVKKLTAEDFEKWARGEVPVQTQTHRNNLTKVLAGADMYIERVRKGTKI